MGPGAASITGLKLAPARSPEGAVPGTGLEAGLTSTGMAAAPTLCVRMAELHCSVSGSWLYQSCERVGPDPA